jgi:hypothetical protein
LAARAAKKNSLPGAGNLHIVKVVTASEGFLIYETEISGNGLNRIFVRLEPEFKVVAITECFEGPIANCVAPSALCGCRSFISTPSRTWLLIAGPSGLR